MTRERVRSVLQEAKHAMEKARLFVSYIGSDVPIVVGDIAPDTDETLRKALQSIEKTLAELSK